MKFNDRIYKEIDWFSAEEISERDILDGIDSWLLLDNLATLEAGYSLDEELTDEMEAQVSDELESLITVGRFKFDSLLASGLAKWFHVRNISDIAGHVRSCWLSCDGDDWYFYFVTGCGYDVISSDLLGCDADGVARRKFVDFLNGEEVAR